MLGMLHRILMLKVLKVMMSKSDVLGRHLPRRACKPVKPCQRSSCALTLRFSIVSSMRKSSSVCSLTAYSLTLHTTLHTRNTHKFLIMYKSYGSTMQCPHPEGEKHMPTDRSSLFAADPKGVPISLPTSVSTSATFAVLANYFQVHVILRRNSITLSN